MDIPDYMTKTYDLNEAASLQYQNLTKEAYAIAIVDFKDQLENLGMKFLNAKEFLDFFVKDYMLDVNDRKLTKVTEFNANKNGHAQVELSWSSDGNDFWMLITTIETKDYFYKILCWTLAEYKSELETDYKRIASSLKE